jgi:diguanylate cyclase (GGDEF)-like protein/PAS domain S-box-containing protein
LKKEIGESEERYRMLVENSPAGIITCDTNGNITTVNLAIAKMLGSPSVEATKQVNVFTFPPLVESGITESLKKCLETGEMIKGEFAYTSKWGKDICLRTHFAPIRDFSGKITGLQGIVEDFTEYKEAQDQLRLYYHVIEHIPVAVNISNENGEIEYINPKYTELTGYTPEEVVGINTSRLYEKGSASELYFKELMATIKAGKIWKREFHNVKKNGEHYWENISASPVFDENGRIYHLIAIKEDITERVNETMKARFLAYHDGLTGLANRSFFYDRLMMALADAQRNQRIMAVMYLDLDGFKDINDTYGHNTGDELLKAVADELKKMMQEGDTVARMGGDEFTVIIPEVVDAMDVERTAARILEGLKKPLTKKALLITASIGIALYPEHGTGSEELVRNADRAMYLAKKEGRNKYQVYRKD